MSTRAEMAEAAERLIDALLVLADGKDDDELVFVDGVLRSVAEELNIEARFDEIEPMTAGEFRASCRASKTALANDEGPEPAPSLPRRRDR